MAAGMDDHAIPVQILYFGLLAERRGLGEEERCIAPGGSARVLYEELDREYGLMLRVEHLRVAINDDFAEWDTLLLAGDRVAFLPPMSGG